MTEEMLFQSIGGVTQLSVYLQTAMAAPILFAVIYDQHLAGNKVGSLKILGTCCLAWSFVFLFLFVYNNGLSFDYLLGIFGLFWGLVALCMLTDNFVRTRFFAHGH